MTSATYDVLGIGNAIVDILARTDDAFLARQGMAKGSMSLIDEARAAAIYQAMGPAVEISGGSAANTIVGVADFGARGAFVGKVKNDQLGGVFSHDIRAAKVAFETRAATDGPATACSYILVTPDGERTMNTYLGAAQNLHPERHRCGADRGVVDHLSRRLSVGSEGREGRVREGGVGRARSGPQRRAHAVGCVLRRPLSRRISRSDAQAHRRSRLCQRGRADLAVRDRRLRRGAGAVSQGRGDRRGDAQREGLRRRVEGRRRKRCPHSRWKRSSIPLARAICSRQASCSGWCADFR